MESAAVNEEFDKLVEEIKSRQAEVVDKQKKDVKLKLYALGKQGKFGDNTDPKPGMFAIKEKYKWEAWNALKGLDQAEAQAGFSELAKELLG